MQGVDVERFESIARKKNSEKFVIFSGGKLEHRKGQDIVLAAFREFYKRHPDSVLLTAWYNPWPQIVQNLVHSPYDFGVPKVENNNVDIAEWCSRSGLPDDAFIHVGLTLNAQMPQVYARADVALFPNRAEGGTNLVAMEAMASGIPCILSANTGHLDLISENNCIPLREQRQYSNQTHTGWGESSINEILNALEFAYSNREQLNQIGINGRTFINKFSWHEQTKKLTDLCAAIY
jgi:glycosyltransferase involved in cell wall biosynthesis